MNFDRNTVLGLLFMLLLGLGYSLYTATQMEEQAQTPPSTDTTQVTVSTPETTVLSSAAPLPDSIRQDSAALAQIASDRAARFGAFAAATLTTYDDAVIENDRIRAVIQSKGGLFGEVTLTDGYTRYGDSSAVRLWDPELSAMALVWKTPAGAPVMSTDLSFKPSAALVDARSAEASLTMRAETSTPGQYLEIRYTLAPGEYRVRTSIQVVGAGNELTASQQPVELAWYAVGEANEKGIQAERSKCSIYFRELDGDRDYLSESAADEQYSENSLNWVAYKQDYFSAAVISPVGFGPNSLMQVSVPEDSSLTKSFGTRLKLPLTAGSDTGAELTWFFGPNDYKILKSLEVEQFDKIIDYGWGIIGWVNKYAVRPLFWFLSSFIGSFGLIILIVTIIIKMVLFPVTWKNFLSSAKMRVLKPEMDEINQKYENKDPMEKQRAIMDLYRQTGVNPFAGCIPVLIQMPILYAMFRFFPAEIVLRGKSFLWAEDLAAYDSILNLGFNIPFYGSHVSGFTLLMCASTFIYTRMSMAAQPAATQPGMPNMKVMMHVFTFMMLFFFNSMPSGLSMYYFTANMISIGQMWVIKNYIIDEAAIRAKIDDNRKKPKKKSSFQQRLEEMQKAQQKKLADQKKKLK